MKTESVTKTSPYLIEVVAAELFMQSHDAAKRDWNLLGSTWRKDADTRNEFRNNARRVLAALESKGIKVAPARPQAVERAAKELAVVPATIAYVIADDEPDTKSS